MSYEDNMLLQDSMAVLFRLNELVLDKDFRISHASPKLSILLSPLNPDIVDEHIASFLQPADFESLLECPDDLNQEFIVQVVVSKGQVLALHCQRIDIAGQHWTVVTTFERINAAPASQEQETEQVLFSQLILSTDTLEVLEVNQLAQQLTGFDSLTGMKLSNLINIAHDELKSSLALATTVDAVTLNTTLLTTGKPVMIKVCRAVIEDNERLLAYIVVVNDGDETVEQLKYVQEISASLFESRNNAVLLMDQFGVINKINSKMTALLGERDLIGKRAKVALPSQISRLISTSDSSVHDVAIGSTGQSHRMQLKQKPLRSQSGNVLGLLLELSDYVDSTDTLKYRAFYAASLAAEHAVFITDSQGKVVFVNEVFEQQTGYSSNDVIDQDVSFLKNDTLDEESYRYLWNAVQNKDIWRGVLRCRRRSGVKYWSDLVVNPLLDSEGNIECIVWLSQDITMDKELQKTGTYLANYDIPTGLANAVLAKDRLEGMIGRARRRKKIVAVIYIDISEFEQLERSYGEPIANGLLTEYCERVRKALRAEDSLARVSNGRIAVLLPDLPNVDALEVVSAKIDKVNQRELKIADKVIKFNFKQGLSYYPEQGISAESLFKNAEASLLAAWSNQNPIGCFGRAYNKKALIHFQLRRELLATINEVRLDVVYQPVCEVKGDDINTVEACLQWQHAEFGLIKNDEIYTLAEASGCVQELGFMLIKQVCKDLVYWKQEGYDDFKVGINLSHGQLRDRNVAKRIAAIIEQHSLPVERLALEVPLSYIATQWLDLEEILQDLSLMGASILYDKFGERGAYISDLRHFPFNGIKLSNSYIAQIDSDPTAANLIQGIIAMATSLNLEVTAIGVEDLSQLLQLQEMGCHYAQGPFFTEFVTRDDLTNYFIQNIAQPRLN